MIRALLAAAVAGTAVLLAVMQAAVRGAEAAIATPVVRGVIGGRPPGGQRAVYSAGDVIYFPQGMRVLGLGLEPSCSALTLIVPVMLVISLLLLWARTTPQRAAVALVVGCGGIVLVNTARVAGIAVMTARWGINPGYEIGHKFLCSFFAIAGFAAVVLLTLKIASGWPSWPIRPATSAGQSPQAVRPQ